MPPLPLEPASWASLTRVAGIIQECSGGITVWGHDDLDGITSVAILLKALEVIERKADYFIPPRSTVHYGLDSGVISRLVQNGTGLIVTVDSGISNRAEVAEAKRMGVKVVVTDHHQPPDAIPEADALVNPKFPEEPRPTPELAGCGVAFYLSAVLRGFSGDGWMEQDRQTLAWAALGTVSDRVSLVGENRSIVELGLSALAEDRALSEGAVMAGFDLSAGLSPFILRKTLVPLIGQTESEGLRHRTLDLLMGNIDGDWLRRSRCLMAEREAELERQAERLRQNRDPSQPYLLVIDGSIRPDMAGTLASRLRDDTGGPAVVVTRKGGLLAGECRSFIPFDCVEFLSSMSGLFAQYGGHRQAAGFTVAPGAEGEFVRLAGEALEQRRGLMSRRQDQAVPNYTFCRMVDAMGIREELAEAAPFGPGNPMPLASFQEIILPEASGEPGWWPISRLLDDQNGNGRSGPRQAFLDITHTGEIIISTNLL